MAERVAASMSSEVKQVSATSGRTNRVIVRREYRHNFRTRMPAVVRVLITESAFVSKVLRCKNRLTAKLRATGAFHRNLTQTRGRRRRHPPLRTTTNKPDLHSFHQTPRYFLKDDSCLNDCVHLVAQLCSLPFWAVA